MGQELSKTMQVPPQHTTWLQGVMSRTQPRVKGLRTLGRCKLACADRRDGDEDSDSAGIFSRYVRDSVNDPRSTAFAAQVSPLPASPVNAFLCTLPLLCAKGCQS